MQGLWLLRQPLQVRVIDKNMDNGKKTCFVANEKREIE
jgi:hypothetical protein